MEVVSFFWLQVLVALISGTAITLGYTSLPGDLAKHAPIIAGGAFFIIGLFVGSITRKSSFGRGAGFLSMLVVGILQAAYLSWLYSQLIGPQGDLSGGIVGFHLPYEWAGCAFIGALLFGLTRARKKRDTTTEYKPSEEEVRTFIKKQGLFLNAKELDALAARPGGLICSICKIPYTGEELNGPQWKERWVRCPRVPEHIFHARDFERAEWRCPVDRTLLYKPKFE